MAERMSQYCTKPYAQPSFNPRLQHAIPVVNSYTSFCLTFK